MAYKDQSNADYEEIIMAARVLADKPNYFAMDDVGNYYAQAAGNLDECIRALEHHLSKMYKIKEQLQTKGKN